MAAADPDTPGRETASRRWIEDDGGGGSSRNRPGDGQSAADALGAAGRLGCEEGAVYEVWVRAGGDG